MSQIFKQLVPINILFDFLDDVCDKTEKYYIFDNNAYKRALLEERISLFCNALVDYYYNSKKYYVNREMNYIKFCTVIRQICKLNIVNYHTKIVYSKSKYHIPYYIYF
jgi:hypothetical protein